MSIDVRELARQRARGTADEDICRASGLDQVTLDLVACSDAFKSLVHDERLRLAGEGNE